MRRGRVRRRRRSGIRAVMTARAVCRRVGSMILDTCIEGGGSNANHMIEFRPVFFLCDGSITWLNPFPRCPARIRATLTVAGLLEHGYYEVPSSVEEQPAESSAYDFPFGNVHRHPRNTTSSATSCPGFAPHFGAASSRFPRAVTQTARLPRWLCFLVAEEVTPAGIISTVRIGTACGKKSSMASRLPS